MDNSKEELISLINNMDLLIDNLKDTLLSSEAVDTLPILIKIQNYHANKETLNNVEDFKKRITGIIEILSDTQKLTNSFSNGPNDPLLSNEIHEIAQRLANLS